MAKSLSVAIVGAGLMGRWHAAYASASGAKVVAVVDPDLAAARVLARRSSGAAPFGDVEECFSMPGVIDVVHLCSPTATHAALLAKALAKNIHVLVEKPLAPSETETAHLLAEAARRGLVLSSVHQFAFQRGVRQLSARLSQLGEPVRAQFAIDSAGGEGRRAEDRREILVEMLPHPVSLLYRLLGDVGPISAWHVHRADADELELTRNGEGPAVAISLGLRSRPPRCLFVLSGTKGTARLDLFHGFCVIEKGGQGRLAKAVAPFLLGGGLLAAGGVNLVSRAFPYEPAYPGLRDLIMAFYAAVRAGGPAPVSADEILAAARLSDLARGAHRAQGTRLGSSSA